MKAELEKIDYELSQMAISQGYIESFELLSQKYNKAINDVYSDRKELSEMVHLMIDEVVVHSRPVDPQIDVISGRKKEGQQMPYTLEVKIRLPRDMMHELVTDQFGVKSSNL